MMSCDMLVRGPYLRLVFMLVFSRRDEALIIVYYGSMGRVKHIRPQVSENWASRPLCYT
jgi:hypothetical protein